MNKSKTKSKSDIEVIEMYIKIGTILSVFSWDSQNKFLKYGHKFVITLFCLLGTTTSVLTYNQDWLNKKERFLMFTDTAIFCSLNICLLYQFFTTKKHILMLKEFNKIAARMGNTVCGTSYHMWTASITCTVYCYFYVISGYVQNFDNPLNLISILYSFFVEIRIFYMIASFSLICSSLSKKYQMLDGILKSSSTVEPAGSNEKHKIILFKEMYAILKKIVDSVNSIFEMTILHLFLISFFNSLDILNVVMFEDGQIIRQIPLILVIVYNLVSNTFYNYYQSLQNE